MEIGSSDEQINQALSIGNGSRLMTPLNWNGRLNKIPVRAQKAALAKLASGTKYLAVENVYIDCLKNLDKTGRSR